VLEEVTESFVGKRGPQTVPLWICLDRSPEGRLRNTFDYEVNADEQEKFGAKAGGKNVEIIVTEIRIGFGNRVRFKGRLRKFAGEEVPTEWKAPIFTFWRSCGGSSSAL
jgi:hypothetical protein